MSACSVKFFTWDLTLKIERTLTHFNLKKNCIVRGRGTGTGARFLQSCTARLLGAPTNLREQHNSLQDTWSLFPKRGFHITKEQGRL